MSTKETTPATRRIDAYARKLGIVSLACFRERDWRGRPEYVFRLLDGRMAGAAYSSARSEAKACAELDRVLRLYGADLTGRDPACVAAGGAS